MNGVSFSHVHGKNFMWYIDNLLFKPSDKASELEKCINLIVTRWRMNNGIPQYIFIVCSNIISK